MVDGGSRWPVLVQQCSRARMVMKSTLELWDVLHKLTSMGEGKRGRQNVDNQVLTS
jgi:hypothetical protein